MALDPNPEEGERFKHLPKQEIPLLYSTRLFPSCIPVFQGSCGYLRSGMSGCLEQWIDKELGLTDSPLGVDLPSTAFSVTLLAAAFAVHCGCDPILFDGVDLAYTNQKRYADGVGSGEEILSLATSPVDRPVKVRNRAGALVTSAVRWTIEASVLSRFAKKNKTRHFIACTKEGLEIKGMQAMPLDIALQSFCTQEYDLRAKVTKACNDHPMPAMCSERINAALAGLHHSLQAVVFHFKLLAENETSGQSALAELELQEELAYQVLFSDSAWALRALEPGGQSCWKTLYEMAKQCLHLFDQNSSI
jgi:hypothetical protein